MALNVDKETRMVLDKSNSVGLTPDKLEQLAEDDSNLVYKYEYDTVDRVLPSTEVKHKLQAIRHVVVSNHKLNPKWSWADHKGHLADNYPELFQLSKSHPKMFDVASHPAAPQEQLKLMYYMVNVRNSVELGKLDEMSARKIVSGNLLEKFKLAKGKTEDDATPWSVSTRPDFHLQKE